MKHGRGKSPFPRGQRRAEGSSVLAPLLVGVLILAATVGLALLWHRSGERDAEATRDRADRGEAGSPADRDSKTVLPRPPSGAAPVEGLQVGNLAPEIEGEDLDGRPFKLSDYRGKVVVLDFWGNW